jgi:hypothetical protein
VGKLFGIRYLATLFGLTLLSHQIGGFLGAYLGGIALAQSGDYPWWYADMALAAAHRRKCERKRLVSRGFLPSITRPVQRSLGDALTDHRDARVDREVVARVRGADRHVREIASHVAQVHRLDAAAGLRDVDVIQRHVQDGRFR